MSDVKFGWHMHSFPVDGSSAAAYLDQLHANLQVIQPHFDTVWIDDHTMPWAGWQAKDTPYQECETSIAFFAAAYPKLSFASSMFCQSYRNPALAAKAAANLQWLTGGRFIYGIGAGWMEEDYRAYNFPFPKPSVRIAQLAEAVQIAKLLWSESPASFEGTYYRIEDAYCEPQPNPAPPVLIGGGGEQLTLRVVAQHADWWNFSGGDLATYAHKLDVLRRHCDAAGRDFAEIVKTWTTDGIALGDSEADARRIAAASPYNNDTVIAGTPEQVAEQLQRFVDLGVEHFVVRLLDFPKTEGIERFAQEVMPLLRAAA